MLRIVSHLAEAQAELERICDRTHDDAVVHREASVREIVQAVQRRGDAALIEFTQEFDGFALQAENLRVSGAELDAAYQQIPKELLDAIRLAHHQIEAFHRQRVPKSWVQFGADGEVLGKRYTPVDRAGLYVPGGRAAYPSTVLMNAVPAKVAGVERVVITTPPGPDGSLNPAVLVAAQEAGIEEIYRVGGAQAIAALAYGTATIPKVDVISGPGNIYVTLAKKLVYGTVGIDSLAGPSEVLIIADRSANPRWVAADLLAQAEHDPLAAAILITPDLELATQVGFEVERQLQDHPRRLVTEKAIAHYGLAIVVDSLETAVKLSNQFAPEHLELEVEDPWALVEQVRHAGAIFLGSLTPEAIGDYVAGPNHTLPTSGAARYASALSVETFLKSSSLIEYTAASLQRVARAVDVLATAEGLESHAESVRLRQQSLDR
ncbi:histidinol dehydrogenase [Synechococcus elongatus]|uniref:Histidinol dehydrogenase n=2 Tax=Synechococcus elongatus TaxID=32046 RepID=HISX_SYNP6|nr:histidinol dehydrogenase [Synechococcus elongatus]Q5MZ26.1 RecName: Full=Histidinol dehydrogenase; Short=HDH [Synechococcus elongatus PCC 6301]ABB57549.1 histidinol dehydrogenase [Synechococcus elongatus PCC 7942 = FACHB-805]AJD57897.1 histidinol dehydrogenase [Synechococcus elongatus UTEX 2973]MBD2588353.1 histidinol dehydrogenase [Synechococcus elongatus FACHB-242]MBD2689484.1 histidinol dehydrogenase [Synechococcus elongatus FACHB-1061]MBD2708097.1 histidinol dehydrogenase [Synechococcu